MSLRINTNLQALTALRSLGQTSGEMQTAMQRLSTGLRVNSASDDPAGLIISETLRTQMRGIDQATRNAQDAINMTKTAEASLEEVQSLIRNMRAIAVHSANTAVVDQNMLRANQAQLRNGLQSINRIAEQTMWGTKRLLDGTAGSQANVTNSANVSGLYIGGMFAGEAIASGPITMTRISSATRAIATLSATFANASSIVTKAGALVINGFSFSSDGTESVQAMVTKINQMSGSTGVTAQISGSGPVQVVFASNDFGLDEKVNFFDPTNILHNSSSATSAGTDAVFTVGVTTARGATTATFTGGQGPGTSGLRLSDTSGNEISITESGNAGMTGATQVGVITEGSVQFHIGAMSNQAVAFSMPNVYANRMGTGVVANKSLNDIDVTSQTGAQDAIRIIDEAVTQLAQWRGDIGAFQVNFLESTVRSLGTAKENIASSESQIRDADMAVEMTNYTRLQILQQSGMAMLSQANQSTQSILTLLRQ